MKLIILLTLASTFLCTNVHADGIIKDCISFSTNDINISSSCVSSKIASSERATKTEMEMVKVAEQHFGYYAMATMTFDPELRSIDIVAHRDAVVDIND